MANDEKSLLQNTILRMHRIGCVNKLIVYDTVAVGSEFQSTICLPVTHPTQSFVGLPCTNKKSAEKSAASVCLAHLGKESEDNVTPNFTTIPNISATSSKVDWKTKLNNLVSQSCREQLLAGTIQYHARLADDLSGKFICKLELPVLLPGKIYFGIACNTKILAEQSAAEMLFSDEKCLQLLKNTKRKFDGNPEQHEQNMSSNLTYSQLLQQYQSSKEPRTCHVPLEVQMHSEVPPSSIATTVPPIHSDNSNFTSDNLLTWRKLLVSGKLPKPEQIAAYQTAMQCNALIILPTGYGKTLIAAMIMHQYKILHPTLLPVLIVGKIPLLYQQQEVVQKETGLRVCAICGESNVNMQLRLLRQRKYDALVITAGLLVELLEADKQQQEQPQRYTAVNSMNKVVTPSTVAAATKAPVPFFPVSLPSTSATPTSLSIQDMSVMIFDECHHSTKSHPYAQVLHHVKELQTRKQLQLLQQSQQQQQPQLSSDMSNIGVMNTVDACSDDQRKTLLSSLSTVATTITMDTAAAAKLLVPRLVGLTASPVNISCNSQQVVLNHIEKIRQRFLDAVVYIPNVPPTACTIEYSVVELSAAQNATAIVLQEQLYHHLHQLVHYLPTILPAVLAISSKYSLNNDADYEDDGDFYNEDSMHMTGNTGERVTPTSIKILKTLRKEQIEQLLAAAAKNLNYLSSCSNMNSNSSSSGGSGYTYQNTGFACFVTTATTSTKKDDTTNDTSSYNTADASVAKNTTTEVVKQGTKHLQAARIALRNIELNHLLGPVFVVNDDEDNSVSISSSTDSDSSKNNLTNTISDNDSKCSGMISSSSDSSSSYLNELGCEDIDCESDDMNDDSELAKNLIAEEVAIETLRAASSGCSKDKNTANHTDTAAATDITATNMKVDYFIDKSAGIVNVNNNYNTSSSSLAIKQENEVVLDIHDLDTDDTIDIKNNDWDAALNRAFSRQMTLNHLIATETNNTTADIESSGRGNNSTNRKNTTATTPSATDNAAASSTVPYQPYSAQLIRLLELIAPYASATPTSAATINTPSTATAAATNNCGVANDSRIIIFVQKRSTAFLVMRFLQQYQQQQQQEQQQKLLQQQQNNHNQSSMGRISYNKTTTITNNNNPTTHPVSSKSILLPCGALVGHGGSDGQKWFGSEGQKVIVDKFRAGILRILVATSVLEEGLDVPQCNLVIRLSGRPSQLQMIQSRGRARVTTGGRFIAILTPPEKRHYENVANQEVMINKTLQAAEFRR